jgi:hypothetical protein
MARGRKKERVCETDSGADGNGVHVGYLEAAIRSNLALLPNEKTT